MAVLVASGWLVAVVAGPHGAGLADIVWAQHLQQHIEVFAQERMNYCYARLAVSLGADYS
jgi:hypothetical protein